ncbi:MAG: hypothetical protein JXQ27_14940 [Acidobacteria bacterium]|nr:hypothetical protein [Acidobacteriota bacterium]
MTENRPGLTDAERAVLQRWQRRTVSLFAAAMGLLIVALLVKTAIGLPGWLEVAAGSAFIVLAVVGAGFQFSAKCPRCGFRIGWRSRLILPPACPRCRVSFRDKGGGRP